MRTKIDSHLKEKIIQLASRIGPKLNWDRDPGDSVQWNGVDIACKNQTASDIIHDIAHWTLASTKRRCIFDFGLGPGPSSKQYPTSVVSQKYSQEEEMWASALGIWWERELGMDWEYTVTYHSWPSQHQLENFWNKVQDYK